jgi:altronate hydrolase
MMNTLSTIPHIGGALLLSLRCESLHRHRLAEYIAKQRRSVETMVIQPSGRTRRSLEAGPDRVLPEVSAASRALMGVGELVLACVSSGSDKVCLNVVAENLSVFSLLLTGLDES